MSLRNNLSYSTGEDKVIGLVDFGDEQTNDRADSVLVAMLRGIRSKWKQPLFFFFTKTTVKPLKLRKIVHDCINNVNSTGLQIVSIITDQGPNLGKCFKDMGCTKEKPSIFVNQKEIFVVPDIPPLIKPTRNILHDGKYIHNTDGIVSWLHIKENFILNEMKQMQLTPKIRRRHIFLPPYGGKMKVKLATHILSHTVAASIGTLIDCKLQPAEAKATELFCLKMDQLFDILNSSSFYNSNKMKNGLQKNSPSVKQLLDFKIWLSSWRVVDKFEKQIV